MKRKMICAGLLALLLLAGCGQQQNTDNNVSGSQSSSENQAETVAVTLYLPDDQAEGLVQDAGASIPKPADEGAMVEALVDLLTEKGALPEGTAVNRVKMTEAEGGAALELDLNDAFGEGVGQMGTAGESMMIGSLVNTLWENVELSSLTLTVEGEVLETGHEIYDAPFTGPLEL